MTGKGKRTWVKFWVTGWLHGSIRWQLDPAERGVWADLICLAGECGQDGAIVDNDGVPLPISFIANQFNIARVLLDRTIAKCIHDNRLINDKDTLRIVNWAKYQSEYERQKPYRQKESAGPEKYIKQKYGHLVVRTEKDLDRIRKDYQQEHPP